jgi:hypothetical protein
MFAAWSGIMVALISGPLMWLLYRLDKNNSSQHNTAVELIKSVKTDIQEIKDMQVWTDLKLTKHIREDHYAGHD